jgi:hypothetical protein
MQKIMKKPVTLLGVLVVALSLSSLAYVPTAEAGCASWDKGCRWIRAQRQAAQHEIERIAAAARHTADVAARAAQHNAEIAAKAAQHNAEIAAKAAQHNAQIVAAAAKHAMYNHRAELIKHGASLAHQIADSSSKELEKISKMIGSLDPVEICQQSQTVLYEQAASAACGAVSQAIVSELCRIGTSPVFAPQNQAYCWTMASVGLPAMELAGLSSCMEIAATGSPQKFRADSATTLAHESCKIIPR